MHATVKTVKRIAAAAVLACLFACIAAAETAGVGTGADPYRIASAKSFCDAAQALSSGEYAADSCFVLLCDVDFADVPFVPFGTKERPFSGTFDGGGNAVKNVTLATDEPCAGVFAYAENALVRDVRVENASITVENSGAIAVVGILCGDFSVTQAGAAGIERCAVEGTVTVKNGDVTAFAGGICGNAASDCARAEMYIRDCTANVNVTCAGKIAYAGGVAGALQGSVPGAFVRIARCVTQGSVTATSTLSKYNFASGIAATVREDDPTWGGVEERTDATVTGCLSLCGLTAAKGGTCANICAMMQGGNVTASAVYGTQTHSPLAGSALDGTATTVSVARTKAFQTENLGLSDVTVWKISEGSLPTLRTPASSLAPQTLAEVEIRPAGQGVTQGIRFRATVTPEIRTACEAYGFLVGLAEDFAGEPEMLAFEGTSEDDGSSARAKNGKVFVYAANYDVGIGKDIIYKVDNDGTVTFSGVLTGIPSSQSKTPVMARPFVRLDGRYFYGNTVTGSLK